MTEQSATPLQDRIRAQRPTKRSYYEIDTDQAVIQTDPIVLSPSGRSWFCPCSATVVIDLGTCPLCGYRRADFTKPSTVTAVASSLIKLPDGKRFDALRDLIPSAERYVTNTEKSSTPGEYRARSGNVIRLLGEIDAEIAKIETKLGAGWDFIDTLEKGDEKDETIDRLTEWLNGYERTCDYRLILQRRIDAAGKRMTR